MFRKDRTAHGGGLMVFIRSDIPCRVINTCDSALLESICVECIIKQNKWLFNSCYKPPNMSDLNFVSGMCDCLDKVSSMYENICTVGDLNLNLICSTL